VSEDLSSASLNAEYWDELADVYQRDTRISTRDFHYGPLLAGDQELGILPAITPGMRCLEIGGGAGQNSLYLARLGAACTVLDVSEKQLEHGRSLAATEKLELDFRKACMDALPEDLGTFDLIHTTYALPFADDPEKVIAVCTRLLNPGGSLVVTTGHPLYGGEWVELDEGEHGLFLMDYFHPPADTRLMDDSDAMTIAHNYPVSEIVNWFLRAGLQLKRLEEPRPLDLPTMTAEEIAQRIPYFSEGWKANFDALEMIPIVLVIRADKA
jgi:SAM-dependent methyltransferase